MDVAEFLKTSGKGKPANVYLFCPHRAPKAREATFEPLLAHRAVDDVVARHVEPSMRDLSYHLYYGDETAASDVVDAARTLPFLTEYRVVVVHAADKYESESSGAALHAYLESPNDTTILMLIAPRIDKRLRLFKLCEKHGVVVECPEMHEREAAAWARNEAQARGKTLGANASVLLVERSGTKLSDVLNAVTLVCNYIGTESTIQESDVHAACADVAEDEIWTLTDAIAQSDTRTALLTLRTVLDMNKSEFEILSTITWLIKTAYFAATANASRVKPFLANKVRPLAEKLGKEKFRDAFALCMNTEVMLRSTGVDRTLALELLVIKLAAPRRPARPSRAS
ncbi:MAG: DNA polymerase III subunit delta [Candidatus Hydrogenedentes bacterium]|nr:DNA polymerase III subunit delta [Candidatus Hydrogenedentota bacterium]